MPNTNIHEDKYRGQVLWYIMYHQNPYSIDRLLKDNNKVREEYGLSPIDYIIPYLHLNRVERQQEDDNAWQAKTKHKGRRKLTDADINNSLRSYLHHFVFVKSNRNDVDRLVYSDWNTKGEFHLSYRLAHSGLPLRMTEDEMRPFIKTIAEYQHKFSFREFSAETLSVGMVKIKSGVFNGRKASVLEVVKSGNGFNLTLGIPVFDKEVMLELYDFSSDDVEVLGGRMERFFEPYFVREVEKELIDILTRRVRHQDTIQSRQRDREKLASYDSFTFLSFEDAAMQAHFRALLLLIASLQKNAEAKHTLLQEVRQQVQDLENPTSDEAAFLLSVLFVATRKGIYRKAVKTYVQTHDVQSPSLLSLMSVLKDINTR